MKKTGLIIFIALLSLLICACSKDVSDKKMKIKSDGTTYEVIYTGRLENGKPIGDGKVSITDYAISFDDKKLIGKYDGTSLDGIPNGNGTFISTTDDASFEYTGEWENGAISGVGNLKYDKYVVHFIDLDREGKYTGDTLNGKASGYGVFKAQNDYGSSYTHEGEWKDGLPDGFGRRVFEDDGVRYVGIFVGGEFEFTLTNTLYTIADYEGDLSFAFSQEEAEFIDNNFFLFPCKELSDVSGYVDENLTYKMIEKNESAYNDSLMIIDPAYVISIEEYDGFDGNILSMILIEDNDNNIHYVYYPAEASDIYSGDYIGCVGYPIGFSSYENMAGSNTKCTVVLGSYITK